MKSREELISMYYKYSPRECEDLIDLTYEKERINSISLEELEREVEFYYQTSFY